MGQAHANTVNRLSSFLSGVGSAFNLCPGTEPADYGSFCLTYEQLGGNVAALLLMGAALPVECFSNEWLGAHTCAVEQVLAAARQRDVAPSFAGEAMTTDEGEHVTIPALVPLRTV